MCLPLQNWTGPNIYVWSWMKYRCSRCLPIRLSCSVGHGQCLWDNLHATCSSTALTVISSPLCSAAMTSTPRVRRDSKLWKRRTGSPPTSSMFQFQPPAGGFSDCAVSLCLSCSGCRHRPRDSDCCCMVPCPSRDECGRCLSLGSTTNAQLSGGSAHADSLGSR